jgi:hypothetical protein
VGRSGRRGEILDPTRTRTPTPTAVQPIASHYTNCAILALVLLLKDTSQKVGLPLPIRQACMQSGLLEKVNLSHLTTKENITTSVYAPGMWLSMRDSNKIYNTNWEMPTKT